MKCTIKGRYSPQEYEHTNRTDQKNKGGGSTSDFLKIQELSKTEAALLEAKIYPRTITRLIREYSEEVILDKAQYWRGRKLVRAIEEDWKPDEKEDPARSYNQGEFADF